MDSNFFQVGCHAPSSVKKNRHKCLLKFGRSLRNLYMPVLGLYLSQGESYVWKKFWQFAHPGTGENAGGGNRERTPNDNTAGWSAGGLSPMQNSDIASVWLVSAMWAGASSTVCKNTILRLLWAGDDNRNTILRLLRCPHWKKINTLGRTG